MPSWRQCEHTSFVGRSLSADVPGGGRSHLTLGVSAVCGPMRNCVCGGVDASGRDDKVEVDLWTGPNLLACSTGFQKC